MHGITVLKPGDADQLAWLEHPPLAVPEGFIKVKVTAAGMNRADILQRKGFYPAPPGVHPDILGLEFAGHPANNSERVMGMVAGAAQATELVIHPSLCLAIPDHLSDIEAAAFPETYLTAWDAVVARGGLNAQDVLLITGAASGVGLAALDLANCLGARTVALSRRASAREALLTQGARLVLDPADPDRLAKVHEFTDGKGVNLVLDLVGAATADFCLDALAQYGRWFVIGLLGGSKFQLSMGKLLSKHIRMEGSVMRSRTFAEKRNLISQAKLKLMPLLQEQRLRPVLDQTFSPQDAKAAHLRMENNLHFGKIVYEISS